MFAAQLQPWEEVSPSPFPSAALSCLYPITRETVSENGNGFISSITSTLNPPSP